MEYNVPSEPEDPYVAAFQAALRAPEVAKHLKYRAGAAVRALVQGTVDHLAASADMELRWAELVRQLIPEVDELIVHRVSVPGIAELVTIAAQSVLAARPKVALSSRGGWPGVVREAVLTTANLRNILSRLERFLGMGPEARVRLRRGAGDPGALPPAARWDADRTRLERQRALERALDAEGLRPAPEKGAPKSAAPQPAVVGQRATATPRQPPSRAPPPDNGLGALSEAKPGQQRHTNMNQIVDRFKKAKSSG